MTLYHADVTVPANTPQSSPVTQDLEIDDEVITKIEVLFPLGCNGLVYVAIFYGPYQLWPRPDGAWEHSGGETVSSRMYWEVPERPCKLTIKAWSQDDTYDHTIQVRIEALPKKIAAPHTIFDKLVSLLRRILVGW